MQLQQFREATAFHGAAIGQTGTSTRQELTAWIGVLAIPCRSIYATDSASMMDKALRLIQAAERDLDEEAKGINIKRGSPFGRRWGLQVDGDLWEQAWIAVKRRGIGNQSLRKVKGHATEEDVAKGISTCEDREGNDKSDKLADKGVEEIAGVGLVKLGKWCEARWKQYNKLLNRVHNMIAGVTLAEKAERAKQQLIQQAMLGYDPEKWIKAKAMIRDEEHLEIEYQSIETITPSKGKHRFSHCQTLYEEVHSFINERRWAPVNVDSETAGTTWLELFIRYDITGYRSEKGQHRKDPEATNRAEKRRGKSKCAKSKKGNLCDTMALTNPRWTRNSSCSKP